MKIGIRSPLTGLIAWAPSATPVLARSVDRRSISVCAARLGRRRRRRPPVDPGGSASGTSGCSGARTMKVAPNSVSGRVVNTRIRSPPGWCSSGATSKSISAPSDRPIQLVCMDPDRLGPVDPGEVEQLVGVFRRPQEPLLQVALLDQRVTAPAAAFGALDLLARERAVVGAPVHGGHRAVRQPGLQEPQEQPLVPAVVARVGGDDFLRSRRRSRPSSGTGGASSRCSTSSR